MGKSIRGTVAEGFAYLARTLSPEEARVLSPYTPSDWHEDKRIVPENEKAKSSGLGYASSPYASWTLKQWGVQPIDDLNTYLKMYRTVPIIKRALDKVASLATAKGFDHEVSPSNPRGPEIIKAVEYFWDQMDVNKLEYLYTVAKDLLIFGFSTTEIVYEDYLSVPSNDVNGKPITIISPVGDIRWLKVLDPRWMRVQQDAYGNIFGYLQYLLAPPQAFTPEKIAFFKYSPWSLAYEQAYGTSQLMSLIRTQEMIWQLEVDLLVMAHAGAKPPVDFACGLPESPWSDDDLSAFKALVEMRGAGGDVFHRHDVKSTPMPQPTTMVSGLMDFLKYLHQQRLALLGVPPQLLSDPEGSTRTTADVGMADFLIQLQVLQQSIAEGIRDEIYSRILKPKFGEDVEIPKIKWHPIFEEDKDKKVYRTLSLRKEGIISKNEARLELGMERDDIDPTADDIAPPYVEPSFPTSFGASHRANNVTWMQKECRVAMLAEMYGYKVYLVDADKVKEYFDDRWGRNKGDVIGNHHYGQIGWYIPSDELWISNATPEGEVQGLIWHEFIEANLMKGGVRYDDAHRIALDEQAKVMPGQNVVASIMRKRPRDRAIRNLEKGLEGDIVKSVIKRRVGDALEQAKARFAQ